MIFIPGKDVLIDHEDNNKVLGYLNQDTDVLFYISEDESRSTRSGKKPRNWNTAMMDKVKTLLSKPNSYARKNRRIGKIGGNVNNIGNISENNSEITPENVF